jgi:RimJ/RimL family protein N-acetyltransferase
LHLSNILALGAEHDGFMESSSIDLAGARPAEFGRRAWQALRRKGARAAVHGVVSRFSRWIYRREEHVWYRLSVCPGRDAFELPEGVRMTRATVGEVDRVTELGQDGRTARGYHAAGNDLWLTLEGDAALFACWTFHRQAPVFAAPGGWMELPAHTVCLEDSVTSPAARGRGIAPASWSAIAEVLAADGVDSMITKVETENRASRRAVEKAGFETIGVMRLTRRAGRNRTVLQAVDPAHAWALAERLHPSLS